MNNNEIKMNDNVNAQEGLLNKIMINAQYIKDLSFENPKAPMGLLLEDQPEIKISLDVGAQRLQDQTSIFEVVLNIQTTAMHQEEVLFVADLHYSGIFTIEVEDGQALENALLVYCPTILFPYARRIISDVTRDGGFPPLMIAPIDFMELYLNKKSTNLSSGSESIVLN